MKCKFCNNECMELHSYNGPCYACGNHGEYKVLFTKITLTIFYKKYACYFYDSRYIFCSHKRGRTFFKSDILFEDDIAIDKIDDPIKLFEKHIKLAMFY